MLANYLEYKEMNIPTQYAESDLSPESQNTADTAVRKGAVNTAADSVEAVLGFLLPEDE